MSSRKQIHICGVKVMGLNVLKGLQWHARLHLPTKQGFVVFGFFNLIPHYSTGDQRRRNCKLLVKRPSALLPSSRARGIVTGQGCSLKGEVGRPECRVWLVTINSLGYQFKWSRPDGKREVGWNHLSGQKFRSCCMNFKDNWNASDPRVLLCFRLLLPWLFGRESECFV